MNRYREQKNIRNRTSSGESLVKKKRFIFSRNREVKSESQFENFLYLGSLDSNGLVQSENVFSTIKMGDCDALSQFLTDKPEFMRVKDQLQGAGLLHYAVEYNRTAAVDVLVEFGVDIHAADDDGNTALHWTAIHNSVDCMLALLRHGADYTKLNNESESVLHIAVVLNRVEYVKTMVNSGNDIDVVISGPKGKTPFHYAAQFDNVDIVSVIADYCALRKTCNKLCDGATQFRLCARDTDNNTPTHVAARAGSAKVLELFFKYASDNGYSNEMILGFISSENSTPLHNAVDGGHVEVIKLLIRLGADPFCTKGQLLPPFHIAASMSDPSCIQAMIDEVDKGKLDTKDQEGRTGLARAIMSANVKVLDLLLEASADPNVKFGLNEEAPLHLAVRINSEICVMKLLDHGADIFSQNGNGDTILHLALCLPSIQVIDRILQHKEVSKLLDVCNSQNLKPIQVAVRHNKLDALKELFQMAPKICEKCHIEGDTYLLNIAAEEGHLQMAQFLIDENYKMGKCIINEFDASGATPLHLAARYGHVEVLNLLLRCGAILHIGPKGATPFCAATYYGNLRIVQILLESFPSAKDAETYTGETPLHLAAMNGHAEIVTYLLDKSAKITVNQIGTTFFYDAIINDHPNVILATLKHKRWQEALDVLSTSKPPPFAALVIRMPSLAKLVLDQSIVKSSFSDSRKNNWISYDFKYLVPPSNLPVLQKPSILSSNSSMSDGIDSISFSLSSTLRATENLFEYKSVDQLYILDMIKKYGRKNLLGHPLVNKFLQEKWVRYGSSLYGMSVLVFLIYLVLLSVFTIVYRPLYDCPTPTWSSVNFSIKGFYSNDINFYVYRGILDVLAFVYLILLIVGVVFAKHKLSYTISIHFIVELLCYVCSLIFLPLHTPCPVWGAGAFAVFFGWLTFMFYIGQYGIFALYTRMLIAVFKTVMYMMPLVLLLICAFAFAFYVLLSPVAIEHNTVDRSLLVVFQMLIGEPHFEYVTDFAFTNETEGQLPSKGAIYFFLVSGGLLITIILTNLLIGLAVGDIAVVREGAFLTRVKDRIIFFGNMDRALPEWVKRDKKYIKIFEYPGRHKFGVFSVIWKHIYELFAPTTDDEMDEFAINEEAEHDRKIKLYEKNLNELKELISEQTAVISSMKKVGPKNPGNSNRSYNGSLDL